MNRIFKEIARKNGVTPKEVEEEIKFAIALAMKDKNPQVQSFWNAVSHSGKIPKPKKIITILSTNLQNKIHS